MCRFNIPVAIKNLCIRLRAFGFEAYIVGGAVRDSILSRTNYDFDIATNALPKQILSVFPDATPYGKFGTILVVQDGIKVEITPYRNDAPGRKPHYTFGGNIYKDLARRDFTINSMAYDPLTHQLIDPYGGFRDVKSKVIRCTGSTKRIWEDPLRAIRAARFQAQLGFLIESSTLYALKANSKGLSTISKERIRDEFSKLILGKYAYQGLVTLVTTDLMNYIIPELMKGIGVMHYNKPVDVLEHNIAACQKIKATLPLRLTALLHDIAKPYTAKKTEKGLIFPDHHLKSAQLARNILTDLRFDKRTISKVMLLVRYHMFYYTTESSIADARNLISKVGWKNIYDLIELRKADRIASGFDNPIGKGLKKLISDLEILKSENSDYQIKDLTINGDIVIKTFNLKPGPQVGKILEHLLKKVIKEPSLNTPEKLLAITKDFLSNNKSQRIS